MKTNYLILIVLVHMTTGANAQPTSSCTNADFELADFSYWTGSTGSCCPVNTNMPGIISGRHTIISGPGTDPNSLGLIPFVPPGGGTYTARLGNSNVGSQAEQLRYAFTVSTDNSLFIYRYAVVLEDPGHAQQEQPRFSIRVFDQGGMPVTCGTYDVVSSANIPGFINNGDLRIKPWTTVGIELSAYIGQTVTIEFTTADCGLGAHFGYAYFECRCYPFQISSAFCAGADSITLYAPDGFASYLWSNGDTTSSITINNPVSGTTYTCTMTSVSGCQVSLSAVLIPQVLNAAFSLADSCVREVKFTDGSHVTSGSPIDQWLWDFGDGTTSIQQSPIHPYTSAGPFAVQLITINIFGCSDTVMKNITLHEKPVAAFMPNLNEGCEPLHINFTDTSTSAEGAITAWQWNFGNNVFSGIHHPSAVYSAGIYSVSLISITVFGCRDTVTYPHLINSYPSAVANFRITPEKASEFIPFISFIDKSQKAESWLWDFGDGASSVETNPVHTYYSPGFYKLTQIVTTPFGCADTVVKSLEYISQFAFYFPNAFSPNGDGKNDVFKGDGIGIKEFKLMVYNRYGQILYATDSENEPWDGTNKNIPVPEGAYPYKANIIDLKNKFHNMAGNVVVIR